MTWAADAPRPGFWTLRVARNCPFVASRIYIEHTTTDPVSGEPMDRSSFLAAQIGLDFVSVSEVWRCVEFVESPPERQQMLITPPLSDRAPRNGRAPAFKTAPLAKWRQEQARRITAAEYDYELRWLGWASRNAPTHPEFLWKKPLDRKAMPVPKFGVVA